MYVYPDKELHIHKYASAYSVITEKMNFMKYFQLNFVTFENGDCIIAKQ